MKVYWIYEEYIDSYEYDADKDTSDNIMIWERDTVLKRERCVYGSCNEKGWTNWSHKSIKVERAVVSWKRVRRISKKTAEGIIFVENI